MVEGTLATVDWSCVSVVVLKTVVEVGGSLVVDVMYLSVVIVVGGVVVLRRLILLGVVLG